MFAGIFFVLPCIESYQKVDLRTITLGVPPQEVSEHSSSQRRPSKAGLLGSRRLQLLKMLVTVANVARDESAKFFLNLF